MHTIMGIYFLFLQMQGEIFARFVFSEWYSQFLHRCFTYFNIMIAATYFAEIILLNDVENSLMGTTTFVLVTC